METLSGCKNWSKPSRLAAMLRAKGAYTSECMTGEIVGVPAVYTAQELAHVDVLLFTSANGVDYFMKNVFASGLDARALFHTRCAVIGQKTAEKLREYGICADFMPEHSNSTNLAQELKEYLDQEFRGDPFKRAVIWYPTAKMQRITLWIHCFLSVIADGSMYTKMYLVRWRCQWTRMYTMRSFYLCVFGGADAGQFKATGERNTGIRYGYLFDR